MGVIINFEEAKKLAEQKRKERLENVELGSISEAVLDHDFLLQELYNRLEFYEKSLETGNLLYIPNEIYCIHNGSILKGNVVKVKYYTPAMNNRNIIYDISPCDESYKGTILVKTFGTDAFYTEEDAINSLNTQIVSDMLKDGE